MKIPNHPVFPYVADPDEAMDKERDESVGDGVIDAAVSHAELVSLAAKWLSKSRKCSVVLTELVTSGETPDAIGWRGTHCTLVECKATRSDFLADLAKPFRAHDFMGVGQYRYYLSTPGVITLTDMPDKWGLLELTACGIRETRKAEVFEEHNHRHEVGLLLSSLRRIGQNAPSGVSIRCYTIGSKNTATIGIEST